MNDTQLPQDMSRRELRKKLIRMRMEMNRQQLRVEALKAAQPLRQFTQMTRQIPRGGNLLWLLGGTLGMGLFSKTGKVRPVIRLGLILAPVLGAFFKSRGKGKNTQN